jgi:hypothetical protein
MIIVQKKYVSLQMQRMHECNFYHLNYNNMKKQLTLMMLAVIFVCGACVFTSCSKDDSEGPV